MAYLRLGEFPVDDPHRDIQVTEMLALPYYEGIDMPSSGVLTYGQGVDPDGVVLAISEDEVEQLEPVRIHRWF